MITLVEVVAFFFLFSVLALAYWRQSCRISKLEKQIQEQQETQEALIACNQLIRNNPDVIFRLIDRKIFRMRQTASEYPEIRQELFIENPMTYTQDILIEQLRLGLKLGGFRSEVNKRLRKLLNFLRSQTDELPEDLRNKIQNLKDDTGFENGIS